MWYNVINVMNCKDFTICLNTLFQCVVLPCVRQLTQIIEYLYHEITRFKKFPNIHSKKIHHAQHSHLEL